MGSSEISYLKKLKTLVYKNFTNKNMFKSLSQYIIN